MNETPQQLIRRALGDEGFLVHGKQYPRPLPAEVEPWYCYTTDGGHCLFVVVTSLAEEASRQPVGAADLAFEAMVPAPVKAVLRAGYEVRDGRIWCDLPYDPDLGLVTDRDDDEF